MKIKFDLTREEVQFLQRFLKQVRISKGVSQKDLADTLSIDPHNMSFYENGKTCPSLYHFLLWIKALDYDLTIIPGRDFVVFKQGENERILE